MSTQHLIPVNIEDMVRRLSDVTVSETEKGYIYQRLKAIRDYTNQAINKVERNDDLRRSYSKT